MYVYSTLFISYNNPFLTSYHPLCLWDAGVTREMRCKDSQEETKLQWVLYAHEQRKCYQERSRTATVYRPRELSTNIGFVFDIYTLS